MLKYAAQVSGPARVLLKPGGRLRRLPAGFDQALDVVAESGIGQHALDLVARDRLQDDPGIMRGLPQCGIELPPHFVGGMIPRPMHIQGEFCQGIEPFDLAGKKVVDWVADTGVLAHAPAFTAVHGSMLILASAPR